MITARGGSKALPGKNLAHLCGKPLIAWTINAALRSKTVTRTIVSTDDAAIGEVAKTHGAEVPFARPSGLSGDLSPSIDAVRHAVRWLTDHDNYHPELVVHLQPTSPLRTSDDIDGAAALLDERGADAVVSLCPVKHHPYWTKSVDARGWLHDFIAQDSVTFSRQQLPPVYAINGAIYMARTPTVLSPTGWFGPRTAGFIMPAERSVDIDTAVDLSIAAMMLEQGIG